MIDNYQVSSIASLEEAILTDKPQVYGGSNLFKTHEEQIELLRRFTAGMHSISITSALVWPTIMDFPDTASCLILAVALAHIL